MLVGKTLLIDRQFNELRERNLGLALLVHNLTNFVETKFNKQVIMTEIFRTPDMQRNYYGSGTKKKSRHMTWEAVDIRDWIYTKDEKKAIFEFLKERYDKTNSCAFLPSGSRTCWLHAIKGGKMHFHIQYSGPPMVYLTV